MIIVRVKHVLHTRHTYKLLHVFVSTYMHAHTCLIHMNVHAGVQLLLVCVKLRSAI